MKINTYITEDTFNVQDEFLEEEEIWMRSFTADFETTTDLEDCRVWAWAVCEIGKPDFVQFGNDLDGFVKWCSLAAPCNMYFHNLGFDGYFLMDWLERNNWLWVEDAKHVSDYTYTTLIGDMNQVYCITMYFTKRQKVVIYDSFKIIPLSIENMAKAYKLPIRKGKLDYTAYREPGHELTEDEKDYIRNDVEIAAMALDGHLAQGLNRMTAGSNALYDFKKMMGGNKKFRVVFPELSREEDAFIRRAYRGGFTWVNPRYQGKKLGNGIVLDVNSLYPSVMACTDGQVLPFGKPVWFSGHPANRPENRPLWIAAVSCSFKVKDNCIPCLQLKGNNRFLATEYITDSKGETTFTCTNVDWQLFTDHYHVKDVTWLGGYAFQARDYICRDYVDKWYAIKEQASKEGNSGLRQVSKLMLNSLYGKFATRIEAEGRKPELGDDDVVHFVDLPVVERPGVYLPMGVFITSWARDKTVRAAQSVFDRFVYADTDSLHLVGTELPGNLDVDDNRIGAWAHETTFDEAKFLRAKCYAEHEIGKDGLTVHVSGMPAKVHPQVTLDNFDFGARYEGKLYTHRVKGGIVLVEGDMEIRK